jgi:integrase
MDYFKKAHNTENNENFFFQSRNGRPYSRNTIYFNFRQFLLKAGISHGGKGKGPRIHDFRHTFAVHCLKKWVENNKDLSALLPVLKTYLGHKYF